MQIDSHDELLVLHKALMERHFVREIQSRELIGSPVLAALANRVLDSLIAIDAAKSGPAVRQEWERWRRMDDSKDIVWQLFLERLRNCREYLSVASPKDQSKFLDYVASPFVLDVATKETALKDVLSTS